MPQFEVQYREQGPAFVRARDAGDAVRRAPGPGGAAALGTGGAVEVGPAAPGTGWCAVTVDGEPWGRVRPRDRMRFRRD